ncbi:MAG: c-type cytochrome [Verrucomicrobiota bacterium]
MVRHLTGLGLIFLGSWNGSDIEAHPAHAKPVNYPFVVGFERFHSSLDDDGYLSEGGFILLNELNCVACHEAPQAWKGRLPGLEGTRLEGVGSRLGLIDLEIMIRSPRFLKKDTTMPSLFSGPDRDLDEVKALKHYLASLKEDFPEYPRGSVNAGRELYHRAGCVACHAPEAGYRPAGIPENVEIEAVGLPSVPLNLANFYNHGALTHFLLHSNDHRPSGRMPQMDLTIEEASDLAAYLKVEPDSSIPQLLAVALAQSEAFHVEPEWIEKGEALFRSKQCIACHKVEVEDEIGVSGLAPGLDEITIEGDLGCFSVRPVGGGVPYYGLDHVQKRAIRASLNRLNESPPPTTIAEIDWRMKQLNCYACHEHEGTGGVETARQVYFGLDKQKGARWGGAGHLPTALSASELRSGNGCAGGSRQGELKSGSNGRSPSARMPVFRGDAVAEWIELLGSNR